MLVDYDPQASHPAPLSRAAPPTPGQAGNFGEPIATPALTTASTCSSSVLPISSPSLPPVSQIRPSEIHHAVAPSQQQKRRPAERNDLLMQTLQAASPTAQRPSTPVALLQDLWAKVGAQQEALDSQKELVRAFMERTERRLEELERVRRGEVGGCGRRNAEVGSPRGLARAGTVETSILESLTGGWGSPLPLPQVVELEAGALAGGPSGPSEEEEEEGRPRSLSADPAPQMLGVMEAGEGFGAWIDWDGMGMGVEERKSRSSRISRVPLIGDGVAPDAAPRPIPGLALSQLSSGIEGLPSDCTSESASRVDPLLLGLGSIDQPSNVAQLPQSEIRMEDKIEAEPRVFDDQRALSSPSRILRQRTSRPDYTSHPSNRNPPTSDSHKRKRSMSVSLRQPTRDTSVASSLLQERVRGRSVLKERKMLPMSDGTRTDVGGIWPKRGENTTKGRLQTIACGSCLGRCHWACAGLYDRDEMSNEPWLCPDCLVLLDSSVTPDPQREPCQAERCMRPDCILRSRVKSKPRSGDVDEFVMERIIGWRKIDRRANGKPVYEYLLKWEDYEAIDSTWEPERHLPRPPEYFIDHFIREARELDIALKWKVALLPEASEWFDVKGDRMVEKALAVGYEPKSWWF